MPLIILDALGIDKAGGGRTSIHTLLQTMFGLEPETRFTVLVSEHVADWSVYPNVRQRLVKRGNRFTVRLYLQFWLPMWARQEKADLVHFTKNLGIFCLPCPYVVTVHDMTTLLLHDQHSLADVAYWKTVEGVTVRGAARVVAVSHDAARDIARFYGIDESSVEVIYWAPQARFAPVQDAARLHDMRCRYRLPERYVLFVGILAKKKNLPTLLRSMAQLRARMQDAPDLVVVGRQYPQSSDTESTDLVHGLGLEGHVHFVGSVPDEDLPLFYAASELYVLPSFHEGFGIPCLEAMACGTPVVTTGGGALPEIVGDAALIVENPGDAESMSAAIEQVLKNPELRADMVQRGLQRAVNFSWEKSAQKMLDIYNSILKRSRS